MTDPIEAAIEAAAIERMRMTNEFAVAVGRQVHKWEDMQEGTRKALIEEERRTIAVYLEASGLARLLELVTELNQVAHSRGGIEAMHTLDALVAQAKKLEPPKE